MLYIRESSRPIDEVCGLIEKAAVENKFGILATHDLKKKMEEKGLPFDHECKIIEVCNPQQAKNILAAELTLSAALPCRISVYEEQGKTKITTIRPTVIVDQFKRTDLTPVADEVEKTLMRIIDFAC
jgi:uncharacterized protein (DUF302 family)